jgi:hypothetical protein
MSCDDQFGPAARDSRRPGTFGRESTEPLDLAAAIAVGLRALRDLRDLPAGVEDGRLVEMLRASLAAYRPPLRSRSGTDGDTPAAEAVAAAIRTACAHLATRSFEDAYLALRTAHDFLPRRPAPSRPEVDHGRADEQSA